VVDYLPWFQVKSGSQPITVHHLMSHTAGIIRSTDIAPHGLYEVFALRDIENRVPPGGHFYYSNLGYKVLGLLLESLLDQPYAEVLQTSLLDPLGMTATHAVMTFETRKGMATGYQYLYDDRPAHSDHPLVTAPWHEYGTGDGSPASTPGDLVAYVRMLLNCGRAPAKRIFSEESFKLLTQPRNLMRPNVFYGWGLTISDIDGRTVVGHGGHTLGYSSFILADMVDGLGAAVLINGPADFHVALDIAQFALKLLHAAHKDREIPPLPAVVEPERVEDAVDYVGSYRMGSKSFKIVAEDQRLILQYHGDGIVLERRGDDRFYVRHSDFARFLLDFNGDEENRVVEAFHGPDWYINDRYNGPTTFQIPDTWKIYAGHYRSHNPWASNFRIIVRKECLILMWSLGDSHKLVPVSKHVFRIGEDEKSPERITFGSFIDGDCALRANFSGCDYYRTFTP
jgi:CubicO group peptidase (beta-lactamase class C family)